MIRKALFLTLTLLFMLGCTSISKKQPYVTVANRTFYVDLATTAYQKNTGLSNRYSLARDWGMLFVYEKEQSLRFWMKDMRFNLDIIWLDENFTITHIVENAPACKMDCPVYQANATYVLELNAGVAQSLGISVNDTVLVYNAEIN